MSEELRLSYQAGKSPVLELGGIFLDDTLLDNAPVNLVLKSLNRHGLIAGATGSGKTKTIQVLAEQLSQAGVPSLIMDIKGDISGLAMPGEPQDFLLARSQSLGLSFVPKAFPVEMLTLNPSQPGLPLRASVIDFGALLFSRMLDSNETQSGVLTVMFEYAKARDIPLIDLADLKAIFQFVQTPAGKQDIEAQFGSVASTSISILLRKIIELEAQGAGTFFGEPAFDVRDLVRCDADGVGIISILRLMDSQDNPKLFSSFMLKLLSDLYRIMPELGDPEKPELILFIDEAHLLFNQAGKALLQLIDTMVKLIRSKGVGLIFCTQSPKDIPESVLSQLGLKIQHALRAFTAKDRQAMKLIAQNFPPSSYYRTEELLTSLGIGEALVSALDEKGQPTSLVRCIIRPPESRMGVLTDDEVSTIVRRSTLQARYSKRQKTISAAKALPTSHKAKPPEKKQVREDSMISALSKNTLVRQIFRQIFREITQTLLKMMGVKRR